MPDHWILRGHTPVPAPSLLAWAEFFADTSSRIVRRTTIRKGLDVSTVFLGLDHSFGRGGPPILFETMVFREGNGQEEERCATWDEAEAMHARIVADVCRAENVSAPTSPSPIKPKRKNARPTVWQHLLEDEDD